MVLAVRRRSGDRCDTSSEDDDGASLRQTQMLSCKVSVIDSGGGGLGGVAGGVKHGWLNEAGRWIEKVEA